MTTLRRNRHKEVKQTPEAVERCGVKPKGKYMQELEGQREERDRLRNEAFAVVCRLGEGRLTNDEATLLASVFVTERLSFQYFEDQQFPWAVRQLARQGYPELANLVKQAFM